MCSLTTSTFHSYIRIVVHKDYSLNITNRRRLHDEFFFHNFADASRQAPGGASDRALNEPNSWLRVGIGSRTCGFELWMVFGVRWVIATGGGCRRTRRRAGGLSPTSLSVSLLAFTSLDFMTLSSRTFPLAAATAAVAAAPVLVLARLPSSSSACVYMPRSA